MVAIDHHHVNVRWQVVLLASMLVVAVGSSLHQTRGDNFQRLSIISRRLMDAHLCQDSCTFTLTESIPVNLSYTPQDPKFMSTYEAHKHLLDRAKQSIHLASFYWTLTDADTPSPDNSSTQGSSIFESLLGIVKQGHVDVKIAQNITNNDTDILAKYGASVRTLDFQRLVHAGVMHTKMWVVDGAHMYIGSGNFDWRSYTQTKELGVLVEDCPCLGADAEKLFQVYWYLGDPNVTIPNPWPDAFSTGINATEPIQVKYNDTQGLVYMSSSPPSFCPTGRTQDLDAIINVIRAAKKFIYISVMDYVPMYIYTPVKKFWPIIDDELRAAAIDRHITVRLMASQWQHTAAYMLDFLKSLYIINQTPWLNVVLEVKLFKVPVEPIQKDIPYARVSHSKYMVTDQHAYVGTSNWAADYFNFTGGIGFILEQPEDKLNGTSLREQMVQVFKRDWNSVHAQYVHF